LPFAENAQNVAFFETLQVACITPFRCHGR